MVSDIHQSRLKRFSDTKGDPVFSYIRPLGSYQLVKEEEWDRFLTELKNQSQDTTSQEQNQLLLDKSESFRNPYQYLPGVQLQGGQFIAKTGGGLCQLGNLLYWMTLHTPLLVTERWRHSFDVFPDTNRTLPFGSGATLAYNYIDLQIKNATTAPYLLHLWLHT
jgi:hypothetical protein